MPAESRPWFYALTLLGGAVAVSAGGLLHPPLAGDGPDQLALIARATRWPAVHWAIAGGYVATVAGLAGLAARYAGTPGDRAARTGALVSAFGYAVSLVGVLFMLGAAPTLADAYARGEPGLAATHAVFTYDMLRPFAESAIRLGAAAISLGVYAFGWAVATGGSLPRLLGFAGVGAGILGVAGAILGAAGSAVVVTGVGLAAVWQVVVAVGILARR